MKKLFVLAVCLVVAAAFVFCGTLVGYTAVKADAMQTDQLRNSSTGASAQRTDDIIKAFGYGFMGDEGLKLLHDKGFRARAARAFNEGRAVLMSPNMSQAQAEAAADEFLKKSGELTVTKEAVVERILKARDLLGSVFTDEFIASVLKEVSTIDASMVKNEKSKAFLAMMQDIAAKNDLVAGRKAIVDDTRYIMFMFGAEGMDPSLYSVGDLLSEDYRALIAHVGTYAYDGSVNIKGGARTIYNTLMRMNELNTGTLQTLIRHELLDMAAGKHVSLLANEQAQLVKANMQIDAKYKDQMKNAITEEKSSNDVIIDTPKVRVIKNRFPNEFGSLQVIYIRGSSKVHPGVPKGSGKKVTLTVAKADVGSPGGHGTTDGPMLEAVAEEWAAAAERGEIIDFRVTRCGDDIMVFFTHDKGKDNPIIHQHIWDGFIRGATVAKDMGYYAAGQDLLAESFSGNVKGAGPGVCEMELTERQAETLVLFQADKCSPMVFNQMLYRMLVSPEHTTWVTLGKEDPYNLMVQLIDFEFNHKQGALGTFHVQSQVSNIFHYISQPSRACFYSAFNRKTNEPIMALTASRLHDVGGEYVGKDDPAMVVRSQKDAPAVGEITMQALVFDMETGGWMRGSSVGPVLPVALSEAKIGGNDGPPLMTSIVINLNHGRITGDFDAFAANPMIREVQRRRSARALERFQNGFNNPGGTKDIATELAYQGGNTFQEALGAPNWQAFEETERKKGVEAKAAAQLIADQRTVDEKRAAIETNIYEKNRAANALRYLELTWGKALLPVAAAFPVEISGTLSDKVLEVNKMKNGKIYPVMVSFDALVKNSPDGIMALKNIVEQLGVGNIKLVLHIEKDNVSETDIDIALAKVNEITGGYTTLSRNSFAAIVVGTDPVAVSADVLKKLGAPVYLVIGPSAYVKQFQAARVVMEDAAKGQITSMAKALNLGMELIPAEGKLTNEQLNKLDALFTLDTATGDFHVKAADVVTSVVSAAEEYARQVEAEIRI